MEQSKAGVLVISWNFPPKQGGMEDLVSRLCKNLKTNRPLFVIAPFAEPGGPHPDWVFRAPRPGLFAFGIYGFYKGCSLLKRFRELQVVLAGSAMIAPLALLLARLFRRKAVVLVHGLDLIYPSGFYQALCVRWLRHSDRVIANSSHTASLAREKKIGKNALRVIPPGVDVTVFDPSNFLDAKTELGLMDHKVVLFVGRLARRKGVIEFVENCLPRIVAEVPEVVFLIVGDNPKDAFAHRDDVRSEIEARVRDGNLSGHVRLLGWLSAANLAKVYTAADLLVMPVLPLKGDVEGFGIVILEAAAAGIPTVATRVGGLPDAVEDGKSGILAAPGNYEEMSQAVIRLLRSKESRLILGKYARERVCRKFNWTTVAQKHEEILDSLAKETSQAGPEDD